MEKDSGFGPMLAILNWSTSSWLIDTQNHITMPVPLFSAYHSI